MTFCVFMCGSNFAIAFLVRSLTWIGFESQTFLKFLDEMELSLQECVQTLEFCKYR
jgi:hypothetical protein